ncbi:MAG: hypothetical protein KDC41_25690 [Saprospiraceae bacterium]|nr:hypothetical protein [Saprospiraceae bacterium]
MKPLLRHATIAILALLLLFGCKRYEEGPYFTLLSKKNRISGNWEVVTATTTTGLDFTADLAGYHFDLSRDGQASIEYPGLSGPAVLTGEWTLEFNKSVFQWEVEGDTLGFYYSRFEQFDILRLTNEDFWLIDRDNAEIRLGR